MNEGSDERRRGSVGKRVAVLLLGMALLSGGLWAWHRSRTPVVSHEVLWMLEPGEVLWHGRINPDVEVTVTKSPHGLKLVDNLPFRRNRMGRRLKNSGLGGGMEALWGEPGESFAMMDERDWLYVGYKSGKIWCRQGPLTGDGWVTLAGAERERVAAMYSQKTGKAWPEEP